MSLRRSEVHFSAEYLANLEKAWRRITLKIPLKALANLKDAKWTSQEYVVIT